MYPMEASIVGRIDGIVILFYFSKNDLFPLAIEWIANDGANIDTR